MIGYSTRYELRPDGWLDVTIIGPEGKLAQLRDPVPSGEAAEPFVREFFRKLQEAKVDESLSEPRETGTPGVNRPD